jgi:hypothetical protein
MKVELTGCSEISAHNIQTPGNQPKERIKEKNEDQIMMTMMIR